MGTRPIFLSSLFTLLTIVFSASPLIGANAYRWDDFTRPYKNKIQVSTTVDVTVKLPASFLEENRELPLIIEHLGLGSEQTNIWRGLLSINNESIWKSRSFGQGDYSEEPIQLNLKASDFKPGLNTFHFSLQAGINASVRSYTITALRFDLPNLAKHQDSTEKTTATTESPNPQALVPAKQLPQDSKAANIVSSIEKTTKRSPSVTTPQAPSDMSQSGFGDYYALVIGNNDYQNITRLKTAVKDARAVAKMLRDSYKFNVTLLINATRSDLFTAFSKLRRKLQTSDNLLIYYAGHGIMDKQTQRGYWLPVDAQRSIKSNWVANEDITSELKAIAAKHVLIVADSCYSGTLTRSLDMGSMRVGGLKEWVDRMAQRRSRTVLTSGGLEPVLDAGGGGHSVFAQAFLNTLRENKTAIDMDSLYETIRRRVVLNADQTPLYSDIRFVGHDDGDFIFVPR
jgi:hypothetical protein